MCGFHDGLAPKLTLIICRINSLGTENCPPLLLAFANKRGGRPFSVPLEYQLRIDLRGKNNDRSGDNSNVHLENLIFSPESYICYLTF